MTPEKHTSKALRYADYISSTLFLGGAAAMVVGLGGGLISSSISNHPPAIVQEGGSEYLEQMDSLLADFEEKHRDPNSSYIQYNHINQLVDNSNANSNNSQSIKSHNQPTNLPNPWAGIAAGGFGAVLIGLGMGSFIGIYDGKEWGV